MLHSTLAIQLLPAGLADLERSTALVKEAARILRVLSNLRDDGGNFLLQHGVMLELLPAPDFTIVRAPTTVGVSTCGSQGYAFVYPDGFASLGWGGDDVHDLMRFVRENCRWFLAEAGQGSRHRRWKLAVFSPLERCIFSMMPSS